MLRFAQALALLYFPFAAPCALVANRPAPDSAADHLKRFIQNPPIIKSMVFCIKSPGVSSPAHFSRIPKSHLFQATPILDKEKGAWGVDDEGFRWYFARWQPNAFLLRQINPAESTDAESNSNNSQNGFSSFGNYANKYWALLGDVLQTWDNMSLTDPRTNAVYSAVDHGKRLLSKAMNLGIPDLGIGSIHWDANEFHSESIADSNIVVSGGLALDDNQVRAINLHYSDFPYRLDYFYEQNTKIPQFLPNRSVLSFVGHGTNTFRLEIKILALEISRSPMSEDYFGPQAHETTVALNERSFILHTQHQIHWQYP